MDRAGRAGALGAVSCLALAQLAAVPAAAPGPSGSVLVIDGGEATRPAALLINRGFRTTLAELAPAVTVYHEAPDLIRFRGEEQVRLFEDYLVRRYRGRTIDVIVASGDPAAEFVLAWASNPWPKAPIVVGVIEPRVAARARSRPGVTGFELVIDPGATLDAARALLPGAKRVFLVSGRDPHDDRMDAAVALRADTLEAVRLRDLSLAETRRRLATLPPDSFVVYSGIWVDGAGQPFTPLSALDQIAPAASRPIFSYVETYLDHDIVGGAMVDNERSGREAARLVVRLLSGEPPSSLPLYELRTTRPVFDARQLDRWRLSEDRLPPGSQVLFRTPTLWREHRVAVVGAAAALLIQAAFIAALLLEMKRRRRLQAELRESSARLMTAQEDERSRIARELHDDVCQRLALLALEAEMMAPPAGERAFEGREAAGRLAQQTRTISSDVHRIAHELHPAILDQLGLVPALRHFAEDLARSQGLRVDVAARDWPGDVPRDVELAFYRVAQEALRNVAKHSGAGEARVALEAAGGELSIRVSDTGQGFEASSARGARLGLASMTERLRQVGGRLVVDSLPGKGTTVTGVIDRRAMSS
jgi:signal transduction histidine kinase